MTTPPANTAAPASAEEMAQFQAWRNANAPFTAAATPAPVAAPVRVGTMTSGPAAAAVTAPAVPARPKSGLSPSEEIVSRYNRIERQADDLGRMIGVKRLRPSLEVKIRTMAGTDDVDVLNMLMLGASVVEIDGNPVTFPKNRAELDATIDGLDSEGINAAMKALIVLRHGTDAGTDAEEVADAKN